jgi:hypothetical protein
VPSNNSPENSSSRRGNADYQWAQFDAEAYFNHYYGEPHPDDDRVIACAVNAIKQARPLDSELDVVDVGTGPNLFPLFCVLPRARSLTVWEYAETNVTWLRAELERDAMRTQWRHFWGVTRRAYGPDYRLAENPMPALRAKTTVMRGSIFDMPARRWDVATMFFCAESITEREDEFDAACTAYARAVKPGGALIAAFLVRSAGYVVADHPFPVLSLSVEAIEQVFSRHVDGMKAETIGIVEREIRSGYSGFVFLTGAAR